MSVTLHPPRPPQDEPDDSITYAATDEFARVRAENERLRDLVVQLSRLVVQNAIARK